MIVTELHARLQEIIDEGNGDMPIVIQAMTGKLRGHSNPHIDKVFYGFDWDNGKVIINPTETLLGAAYSEKRRESARKAGEKR
jgi:hypothetical protein